MRDGRGKGLAATGSPIVAPATGALTATFGGVLRDLLAGEPSVLLRPEIYVSAALIGAGAFVLASLAGLPLVATSALGVITAFAVRGGALRYGWTLPTERPVPAATRTT